MAREKQPYSLPSQEVEVYVKSTQTDMVSMELQRNEDEDEDDLEVEVVSSGTVTSVTQPESVLLIYHTLTTFSISSFCRRNLSPILLTSICRLNRGTRLLQVMSL